MQQQLPPCWARGCPAMNLEAVTHRHCNRASSNPPLVLPQAAAMPKAVRHCVLFLGWKFGFYCPPGAEENRWSSHSFQRLQESSQLPLSSRKICQSLKSQSGRQDSNLRPSAPKGKWQIGSINSSAATNRPRARGTCPLPGFAAAVTPFRHLEIQWCARKPWA